MLLARHGQSVEVFEQEPSPGPVGAGLLLQPTGMAVLERLGVLERVSASADPVRRIHGATVAGRTVMDLRYEDLRPGLHALGVHRGVLFGALHEAVAEAGVPVHAGVRIAARRGGVLTDADGNEHGPYDLVVAADGARTVSLFWSVRADRRAAARAAGIDAPREEMIALALRYYTLASWALNAVFQHDREALAWPRDHLITPAARVPPLRRLMLGTLTGRPLGGR